MRERRIGVAALSGIVVLIGAVSTAWACTGQPQIFTVSPLTAPVGTEVTMRGTAVAATTPVELRWNGVAGPKLAEVQADAKASFELAFTVPDVAPGVYSVVVVTGEGGVPAVGRTTLEVSGAGAPVAELPRLADSGFAAETEAAGLNSSAAAGWSAPVLVGAGVLGFASVAMLAGLAFATLRRRPARAPGTSNR